MRKSSAQPAASAVLKGTTATATSRYAFHVTSSRKPIPRVTYFQGSLWTSPQSPSLTRKYPHLPGCKRKVGEWETHKLRCGDKAMVIAPEDEHPMIKTMQIQLGDKSTVTLANGNRLFPC